MLTHRSASCPSPLKPLSQSPKLTMLPSLCSPGMPALVSLCYAQDPVPPVCSCLDPLFAAQKHDLVAWGVWLA